MAQDNDPDSETLTAWDKAGWHLINSMIGVILGFVALAVTERAPVAIAVTLAWIALAIWLAKLGFWDFLGNVVIKASEAVGFVLGGVFQAVYFLLTRAIALLLLLFVLLGIAGLLWFGIQQLF